VFEDSELDEIVFFEMPTGDDAQQLWLRLHSKRLAWLHHREDRLFVAVALRAERWDLALLLREVQAWVSDCGLSPILFDLDGRCYEMRARGEALARTAA
jgi:hypothetical protein